MKKVISALICSVLLISALGGCQSPASSASQPSSVISNATSTESTSAVQSEKYAAFPKKEVELTCPYSPGGGSDIFARTFAEACTTEGGVAKSVMVVNKPGGSGAVGNSYIYGKKGDDYALATMVGGQMMTAMVNKSDIQANMLTPIACMALDEFTLAINTGRFESLDAFIQAAKDKPGTITVAGSGKASDKQLCMELMNKYLGVDLKYVSFDSGGEVLSAMMGGHVDAGICGPSEIISQIEANKVTCLATFSPQRLNGIDAPTFTELGYPEMVFQMFRSIAGPPNMDPELVAYWEEVCRKISESESWQKGYCEKNMLTNQYMDSKELANYWDTELERYKEIWTAVGLMK